MIRRALALLACLAVPVPAVAQLEGAAQLEAEGDLIAAARAYHAALSAGGLSAADTARAHARLGVLDRATGDSEGAWAHFAVALGIDPGLTPPAELPPDERGRFEAMRGSPYAIEATVEDGAVRVRIRGAPSIARSVRAGDTVADLDAGRATLARPAGATAMDVVALDEHGNTICAIRVELPPVDLRVAAGAPDCADAACTATPPCAMGGEGCDETSSDPAPLIGGIVGAVLGVAAAVLAIALSIDAHESSLWRVDAVELR